LPRNSGKPIVEAEFDIADAATCFEYYGGLATKISGTVNPVPDNALSLTLKEPVGVAGQIIPLELSRCSWPPGSSPPRSPPAAAASSSPPSKPRSPPSSSPAGSANAASPGVVNIVTGYGETSGARLVTHPGVDKIAFTGSAAVGKIIMRSAADTLKRVTLELGGKSPNIFFADADFEAAIDGALFGVFINQGEVCSAGSRVLVERSIYSKFVEAMTEKAKKIVLGPPLDRDTKMGPLSQQGTIRPRQELSGVRQVRSQDRHRRQPPQKSRPRLLRRANHLLRRRQLRPHRPRRDLRPRRHRHPLRRRKRRAPIANDTPFGLAAAVWSRDIYKALRVVKAVRAGIVWVNHMQPTYVEAPWGGYKQSGFGRELGLHGHRRIPRKQASPHQHEKPMTLIVK
jgi:betaine-aldehyde dehydrogenase